MPRPENRERLNFAEEVGLNVSEVINDALAQCAKKIIEQKVKAKREALSVPVP